VFVAILATLIALGDSLTLVPALLWGAGFPLFMILKNWKALKYSRKRPFNPSEIEKNFSSAMVHRDDSRADKKRQE
jgi:hypothetical protein